MGRPDLDAIEARLKAATPGPWHNAGYSLKGRDGSEVMAGADVLLTMTCYHRESADADLIANAPTDLAALLAYVRELEEVRAERDQLLAYIRNVADLAGYHQEIAAVKPGDTGHDSRWVERTDLDAARAAYATRYDDGEGRPVAELITTLLGEIDALRESRERVRAEADRLEQERDRLARVLRCERGEWAPEGWSYRASRSCWRGPVGAAVERTTVWANGREVAVWRWWRWTLDQHQIGEGTAPTALEAIEAANAAIKETS